MIGPHRITDAVVSMIKNGVACLRGLTAGAKALAIASIAHSRYRDGYLRYVYEDPWFTKPRGFSPDKVPQGVVFYEGSTRLPAE
jgi:hypothetical protein